MTTSNSTPTLYPCLRGEALAKQGPGAIYLPQLRALVSAPSDRYTELYVATLYRFMELCQALPLTSPFQHQGLAVTASPYSLLNRALSLAVAALKMRRGWLMSLYDSDSEKIAQKEPSWTYALFTTVLFHAIPTDWQMAYTVGLYQNEEKRLGTWHPVIGSLYEPQTFYQIEKTKDQKPPPIIDQNTLLAAWTGRLIPSIALRWLGNSSEVFPVWWEALTQPAVNGQNVLFQYLRQVAEKLGISLAESPAFPAAKPAPARVVKPDAQLSAATLPPVVHPTKTPLSPARQALIRLNQWLTTQQESTTHTDHPFIRVEKGLLIEDTGLQRIIGQYTMYASVEALIHTLAEFLVADNKTLMVCYRPKRMESREIRRGVVLAQTHLTEEFQRLPVCEDFIPDLFAR